tara:strand:- start:20 stop:562 length:543 start_codon:yes stop_codon:yes gene_type:complete
MLYATVREDLKNDETEAHVMPLVTVHSADMTISDSDYPIRVLHQDDDGLVYLLLNNEVVVGDSIDFDFMKEDKKMKYTQGPWEIEPTSIGDPAFISDIHAPHQDNPRKNGTNPTVATTWHRPSQGEDEANARLISAAPELLECLQEWNSLMINSGAEGFDEIVEQTEKAITKAVGIKKEI